MAVRRDGAPRRDGVKRARRKKKPSTFQRAQRQQSAGPGIGRAVRKKREEPRRQQPKPERVARRAERKAKREVERKKAQRRSASAGGAAVGERTGRRVRSSFAKPGTPEHERALKLIRKRRQENFDRTVAPAVKVLDIVATPGREIGRVTERAAKDLGAPKWAQTAARYGGEFGLDPLTYLTGGRNIPAKIASQKAGEKTYKAAVKSGASHKQATRKAERAAKKREASDRATNQGIDIRFAGKSVPGVARATAAVSRKTRASKAATKVRESRAVQAVAADVAPRFRPKGMSREQHDALRGALRESRAQATRGRFYALQQARGLKKRLKKDEYGEVVNAIERGTVYNLPDALRTPAREVELAFRRARKAERKAGIEVPNRRHYFAHMLQETAEAGGRRPGTRVIRPEYAKGRKHQGTIREIAQREGIQFSEDVPQVVAQRLAKSARNVAGAKLNRALLDVGRKWSPGNTLRLEAGEQLFRVRGSDITEVAEKQAARLRSADGDEFVVLNKKAVDEARSRVLPGATRSAPGRAYDKLQGAFKFTATVPNPGFHVRNLVGDVQNAVLIERPSRVARNLATSTRALHRLSKQEEALRKGKRVSPSDATVTVRGKYGGKEKVRLDDIVREAEQHGAIRAGFVAQELPELLKDVSRARATGRGFSRPLARLVQNREDLVRFSTYLSGRQRGLSARAATDRAMGVHFDYGDLTRFERSTLRRLIPFYTFTARNIPLQAKTLVTRPGKYANFEKARQEAAMAFGFSEDWQQDLREYQQRGVPIPVKWNGQKFAISPALPLQDLSQVTIPGLTTKDFLSALDEQAKKGVSVVSPLVKSPVELLANYHFFFRGDIEREDSPLVAAPEWVENLPASWRKKLGVVDDYLDKRTGKRTWGWPGKVDYVAELPPGPFHFLSQISTEGTNRRGQGGLEKTLSYLLGVKPDPVDRVETMLELAYNERKKLQEQQGALRQRGQSAESPTSEYKRVSAGLKRLEEYIAGLRKERGDAVIPGQKKAKKSRPGRFDFGGEPEQPTGGGGRFDFGGSAAPAESRGSRFKFD